MEGIGTLFHVHYTPSATLGGASLVIICKPICAGLKCTLTIL